jgi:ribosome-binding ATPase YchF (GTP1/OBG family)
MNKQKNINQQDEFTKLTAHVSLALKSFNLTIVHWKNSTINGHLQSIYKKKKYIFFICNHLSEREAYGVKFKASIDYCDKNNFNYIVVAKTWDSHLNKFAETDDFLWKIIQLNKLTSIGKEYLEQKELEDKKIA